jgi:fatty acid desaturase
VRAMQIVLSDPTYAAGEARWLERFALRFINDARDLAFLRLMVLLSVTAIPTGVWLFVGGFRPWLAGVHLALVLWFLGPYILMLHNTCHRRLFKTRWRYLNFYIPWVLGPFFGETPDTYFAHHVGMHHPENNLDDDVSSTLPYRRDSFFGFVRYFVRFFFGVIVELPRYFVKKRRHLLAVRSVCGELVFFAMLAGLAFIDVRATVAVFVVPYLVTRFLMMCGNWGQHAFVDESTPESAYRNSITCINTGYNRRCFNDGYHIGHHVKATRHWTEMPTDFSSNLATYARERAIVFSGIDFFAVWVCLMLKRYDWLARRYVPLEGAPSEAEIIALLKSRVRWTRPRSARPVVV